MRHNLAGLGMKVGVRLLLMIVIASPLSSQDTVRVRADGPPVWGEVRLVQELAVGQVDGPPEYAFGNVYLVAPAADGSFFLFDGNDGQIRRYDGRGRFTGLIGRKGGGPGEYQSVGGMAVDAAGSLVVFDPGSRRVTHFAPDGKVRREWRTTRSAWNDFFIDSAGRFYFRTSVGRGGMEGPGVRLQFVRHSPDTRVLDSLPIPQLAPPVPPYQSFYLVTSDGGRSNFTVETTVAPNLAGGIVAARSDRYRIIVNDGRTVKAIERTVDAVRLAEEERENWLEWADSMRVRNPRGQYDVPRVKPFIRDVRTDYQGRIWVDVYAQAERRTNLPPTRPNGGKQILFWRERTTYDVFAPDGRFLGRVRLPAESRLLAIQGERLYTIARGPDDEQRLIVYRLQPSTP